MFTQKDQQPYYNQMTQVFKNSKISNHTFQERLYQQLKVYFKQLDPDVELNYHYGKGYPAQFSISFEGIKIMTFSFYYHTYKDNFFTERISDRESDLKRELRILEEDEEELEKYTNFKSDPYEMLKRDHYKTRKVLWYQIRDLIAIFRKRKLIYKNLGIKIDQINKRIKLQDECVKRIENDLKNLRDNESITNKKHREWETRFTTWGYVNTK